MIHFTETYQWVRRSSDSDSTFDPPQPVKGRIFMQRSDVVSIDGKISLAETIEMLLPADTPVKINDRIKVGNSNFYVQHEPHSSFQKGRLHHKKVRLMRG